MSVLTEPGAGSGPGRAPSPDSSSAAVLEELVWGLTACRVKSTRCHRESLYRVVCVSAEVVFLDSFSPYPYPKWRKIHPYLQAAASTWEAACRTRQQRREEGREEIWTFLVSTLWDWT